AVAAETAKQKASARRNAGARKTSTVCIKLEADRANVDDVIALTRRIEPAAQVADLHVDDVGLRHELEVPDVLEQHGPRHDLARPAHEILEQLELARQEFDRQASAAHLAVDQVHFQRADLQPGRARLSAAPHERFDAGAEFANVERLDEIVVAAGLQAADTLVHGRQGADHQNGRRIAFLSQRLDDRQTVCASQHPIDHEDRGPAGAGDPEPFVDVIGYSNGMSCGLEFEAHLLRELRLVLNQQDRSSPRVAPSLRRRSGRPVDNRNRHRSLFLRSLFLYIVCCRMYSSTLAYSWSRG